MNSEHNHNIAPGVRISLRGEDFLVTKIEEDLRKSKILYADGISEVVRGKRFVFDTAVDKEILIVEPNNTRLIADTSGQYLKTKLFLETRLRNSSFSSKKIEISHKAAINFTDFKFDPTLKSFNLLATW
jgi:hypothetical protein